jgi:hypothetical protein
LDVVFDPQVYFVSCDREGDIRSCSGYGNFNGTGFEFGSSCKISYNWEACRTFDSILGIRRLREMFQKEGGQLRHSCRDWEAPGVSGFECTTVDLRGFGLGLNMSYNKKTDRSGAVLVESVNLTAEQEMGEFAALRRVLLAPGEYECTGTYRWLNKTEYSYRPRVT